MNAWLIFMILCLGPCTQNFNQFEQESKSFQNTKSASHSLRRSTIFPSWPFMSFHASALFINHPLESHLPFFSSDEWHLDASRTKGGHEVTWKCIKTVESFEKLTMDLHDITWQTIVNRINYVTGHEFHFFCAQVDRKWMWNTKLNLYLHWSSVGFMNLREPESLISCVSGK